jgi:hypothetical protein
MGKAIADAPRSANIASGARDLIILGRLTVAGRQSRLRSGINRQQRQRSRVPQMPALLWMTQTGSQVPSVIEFGRGPGDAAGLPIS